MGVCFVVVFFVGFGTGRVEGGNRRVPKPQINYTTKATEKTVAEPAKTETPVTLKAGTDPISVSPTVGAGDCPIKGNISAKDKVYHLKGGAFYDRTKEEMCFKTEAEAVAAGFRKSSR